MLGWDKVAEIGLSLVDDLFTSDEEKDAAKLKLMSMQQSGRLAEIAAAAQVVTAEAKSEHWLTANWRPITMLVFVALIVLHWLGWTAPNITEVQMVELLALIKVGLGGYVLSRGAEKVMKEYKR